MYQERYEAFGGKDYGRTGLKFRYCSENDMRGPTSPPSMRQHPPVSQFLIWLNGNK